MAKKTPPFINCPDWTTSKFFTFVRSNLRSTSAKYPTIANYKKNHRRPYKGSNPRMKWEYQCKHCKGWFTDKQTSVDHIIPVGSLKSFDDIQPFCERLFCHEKGLQILCDTCHQIKTKHERESNVIPKSATK